MRSNIFSVRNTEKSNSNRGFTLVELIIVVAIIAVLAAVLAPQYIRYVERSRQSNDLQVATNVMRAATAAIADPQNGVPMNTDIYVVWETDSDQENLKGQLSLDSGNVSMPSPGDEEFERNLIDAIGATVGGTMGTGFVPGDPITPTTNRYHWVIDIPMSASADTEDFKFRIDVSTGEFSFYEDQNLLDTEAELASYVWTSEIGIKP